MAEEEKSKDSKGPKVYSVDLNEDTPKETKKMVANVLQNYIDNWSK
jgi:hypothetical protein